MPLSGIDNSRVKFHNLLDVIPMHYVPATHFLSFPNKDFNMHKLFKEKESFFFHRNEDKEITTQEKNLHLQYHIN